MKLRALLYVLMCMFLASMWSCDESTDDQNNNNNNGEDVAAQDAPESPDDYQGLKTLCPTIEACNFGFTAADCESQFLTYCKDGGNKDTYLECMEDCQNDYVSESNCENFKKCETNCWGQAGC